MYSMTDGYPYVFVMKDKEVTNRHLEYTLQYRFKSTKSHHTYIVRIEKYPEHVYCVKFFDKAAIHSEKKYSLRSNTGEPRTILYTVYHIVLDVLHQDELATFFFIGSEDEKDEIGQSTRRYRIYRRFVASIISDEYFEHYRVNQQSLYVLFNKKMAQDSFPVIQKIIDGVSDAFASHL